MAQVKKPEVQNRILDAAREAFLAHGFSAVSLSTIARRAGLSKPGIYTYYQSKEALFGALVLSAVSYLEELLSPPCKDGVCHTCDQAPLMNYEETLESFKDCAQYVFEHHDAFRLLLFCATGSYYRDFKERITQMYSRCFIQLFRDMGNLSQTGIQPFHEMFVHSMASLFVSYLEEIVHHAPTWDQVMRYVEAMAMLIHQAAKNLFALG